MSALKFKRKGRRASTNHGWKSVNPSRQNTRLAAHFGGSVGKRRQTEGNGGLGSRFGFLLRRRLRVADRFRRAQRAAAAHAVLRNSADEAAGHRSGQLPLPHQRPRPNKVSTGRARGCFATDGLGQNSSLLHASTALLGFRMPACFARLTFPELTSNCPAARATARRWRAILGGRAASAAPFLLVKALEHCS